MRQCGRGRKQQGREKLREGMTNHADVLLLERREYGGAARGRDVRVRAAPWQAPIVSTAARLRYHARTHRKARSGEWSSRTARRRRNPPGNAQADERLRPGGLWRAIRRSAAGPPKGCGVGGRPALDLSGPRTEGRGGNRKLAISRFPPRLFFWCIARCAPGEDLGQTHTSI